MPIYEYVCSKCQNVFEQWLKLSETTECAPCPKCGGQARHIISNTAFVLKGGGWYVTDYGYRKGVNEGGQAAAGAAGSPSVSSPAGGSGQDAGSSSAPSTPSCPAPSATGGAPA